MLISLSKWAQLVGKRVGPLWLELDLVVRDDPPDPAAAVFDLTRLLVAGDRLQVTVLLTATRSLELLAG
jgi:hypothetical protein